MKDRIILHPFLFALYSPLSLLASNLGVVRASEVLRPAFFVLVSTLLLYLLLQVCLRDWAIAGVMCTVCVVLFFTYGHAYLVVLSIVYKLVSLYREVMSTDRLILWVHVILMTAWVGIAILSFKKVPKIQISRRTLNNALSLTAAIALVLPIMQIVRTGSGIFTRSRTSPSPEKKSPSVSADSPDIYYIVLDGYGRKDLLHDAYEYDNSPFLDFLQETGFYIAEDSRSNYAQTVLSLGSSLNMVYLSDLAESPDASSKDVNWLVREVRDSAVRRFLAARGYQIVAFSSGYGRTEIEDADIYLEPPTKPIGTLESLLIQTSAALVLEDLSSFFGLSFPYPGYAAHRQRVLYAFDQLPEVAEIPGPKFVFVHILIPHPPFVFDSEGEPVRQKHKYGLRDASDFQGSAEAYIQGYNDQVSYLNKELMAILPTLLNESTTPPVVVLQGDHGPAAHLDWLSPQMEDMKERMLILNAIFLPCGSGEQFYLSMSPVNTFRMVFNQCFDMDFDLLEDESFFSRTYRPFDFVPIPE
jgi:hypothetical protein